MNKVSLKPPIVIDATWEEGYRKALSFDPRKARSVDEK